MLVKASIIGHFADDKNFYDGQTIKTKIIAEELQNQLGKEQVIKIDTHGGLKTLLKSPIQVFKALKKSANILMFPAHNGLRVFTPLLTITNFFFKDRKLHYVVIGGWLPEFLKKRNALASMLKKFDGIYVETNTMKKALEEQGFSNVYVMPNCKKLTVLSEEELIYPSEKPYKLCTFSRVMKEKGIEDAVNVVKKINSELGYNAYSLDIYGQIDNAQIEWFENLKTQFPEYINYCGCVDSDKSVQTLKNYFGLLFPTHFYTEGIPGTIIDAYAAGIPVISAKWENYSDIVDEWVTGIGYEFDNEKQFLSVLLGIVQKPEAFLNMKVNCIKKAKKYIPELILQTIINKI